MNWVQLDKKNYRDKLDHDANPKRGERAKQRKQLAVEGQEGEAAGNVESL